MRARHSAGCIAPGFLVLLPAAGPALAVDYFVDCARGEDVADGRTPDTAWRSLDRVNSGTFLPGDRILLRRDTTCAGMLRPLGSGAPDLPIVLGAYGSGAYPVIEAGDHEAAIKLFNQEYWHLQEIETTGGNPFGIYISGDSGPLAHFRITDMLVHDVRGIVTNKESGLIVVSPASADTTFHDVVIDGVTAHTSTRWAGILVGGDDFGGTPAAPRSTDVTIRNCTVHDVHGDGIVLYQVDRGLIETSVAYRTGLVPTTHVGTPNGIWTWMCGDCTVQYNEGYLTDSPGVDGGVFDIDYGCSNNVVQYNYAHDAAAYCVSIFGAHTPTRNSVVRFKVCADNARDPAKAYQGEIYLFTWAGGRIDGVEIHNNTIHWSPAADGFALNAAGARFSGILPRRFENNIVYSATPQLVDLRADSQLALEWHPAVRLGPGPIPWRHRSDSRGRRHAGPMLLAFVGPDEQGTVAASRNQVVFLRSMARQHGGAGLTVTVLAESVRDWNLPEIGLLGDESGSAARGFDVTRFPTTLLIDDRGFVRARWEGFTPAHRLDFAVRAVVAAAARRPTAYSSVPASPRNP